MASSCCTISEMDDGLHRGEELWMSHGVAVTLPESLLGGRTLLFCLQEALVNSFAASRCVAKFDTTQPVAVDTSAFFYTSPKEEGHSIAAVALAGHPPSMAASIRWPNEQLARGDRLIVARRTYAVAAKVRAVDGNCFWYDVDPRLHAEHALPNTKGSAVFTEEGNLVGLRAGVASGSYRWTHVAVSVVGLLNNLEEEFVKKKERNAALSKEQMAIREDDDKKTNQAGPRVIRHMLRAQLRSYVVALQSGENTCPKINVRLMDGGGTYVAACAARHGIKVLLSLAMDFYAADELEAAAEIMMQIAVVASAPGEAGFQAAKEVLIRPDFFVDTAAASLRGGGPRCREEESEKCSAAAAAAMQHVKLQELLAGNAGEALAAVARRVDASGLAILAARKDVCESVVAALRNISTVDAIEASLVSVTRWLWGTLRLTASLCRAAEMCVQLRDAGIVRIMDALLPSMRGLARRGSAIAGDVAEGLAMWSLIVEACGRCEPMKASAARRNVEWEQRTTEPIDSKSLDSSRYVTQLAKQAQTKQRKTPVQFYEYAAMNKSDVGHPHILCLREQCGRIVTLPPDEINRLVVLETDDAERRHKCTAALAHSHESARVQQDSIHQAATKTPVSSRAQLPCPFVPSKSLRSKIFGPSTRCVSSNSAC